MDIVNLDILINLSCNFLSMIDRFFFKECTLLKILTSF